MSKHRILAIFRISFDAISSLDIWVKTLCKASDMKYKMQQKQNQRIQQITDSTIIVGADIAKHTHVARAIDFRGIELGKECVFTNDDEGMREP